MTIPADMDETARLVLMEMTNGERKRSLVGLKLALADLGQPASTQQCVDLWTKYMGWDGRVAPTHDLTTGRNKS